MALTNLHHRAALLALLPTLFRLAPAEASEFPQLLAWQFHGDKWLQMPHRLLAGQHASSMHVTQRTKELGTVDLRLWVPVCIDNGHSSELVIGILLLLAPLGAMMVLPSSSDQPADQ